MREILGEMSDREYLVRRAIAGTMPRLNRVFEEFGIHHEEHEVPTKVYKSIEDKARKANTKNTTAMAEVRKRKGATASKVITKRRKTRAASAAASTDVSVAASANDGEEVAENVGGALASLLLGREASTLPPPWILVATIWRIPRSRVRVVPLLLSPLP